MSDPYDPQAPEGDTRRPSQYISRKDWRIIATVLVVLAIAGYPIFKLLLANTQSAICSKNLRKISEALLQYMNDNDDRMPFAYERGSSQSNDPVLHGDFALTWQWPLAQYTGDWSVFECPAGGSDEATRTSDGSRVHLSNYGMLDAYSGVAASTISNPSSKFLISETSRHGVLDTSDPLPLKVGSSILSDDGFVIGFDNNQEVPDPDTLHATRLAFPGSAKDGFDQFTRSRHPGGIRFLFVDGHEALLNANAAKVILLDGHYGPWDVPKQRSDLGMPPQGQGSRPSISIGR